MKEFTGFRGDRLREAMKENGASLNDIAEVLKHIKGLLWGQDEKHHLFGVVNGGVYPTNVEIFAICKAVNVSADYLLGLSDEMY